MLVGPGRPGRRRGRPAVRHHPGAGAGPARSGPAGGRRRRRPGRARRGVPGRADLGRRGAWRGTRPVARPSLHAEARDGSTPRLVGGTRRERARRRAGGLHRQRQHRGRHRLRDPHLQGDRPRARSRSTPSTARSTVHAWDRPDVEVVVEKQAQDDARLQEIAVEKSQDGDHVTLRVRGPAVGGGRQRHGHRRALLAQRPAARRGAQGDGPGAAQRRRLDHRRGDHRRGCRCAPTTGRSSPRASPARSLARTDDGSIRFREITGKARRRDRRRQRRGERHAHPPAGQDRRRLGAAWRSNPAAASKTTGRSRPAMAASKCACPRRSTPMVDAVTSDGRIRSNYPGLTVERTATTTTTGRAASCGPRSAPAAAPCGCAPATARSASNVTTASQNVRRAAPPPGGEPPYVCRPAGSRGEARVAAGSSTPASANASRRSRHLLHRPQCAIRRRAACTTGSARTARSAAPPARSPGACAAPANGVAIDERVRQTARQRLGHRGEERRRGVGERVAGQRAERDAPGVGARGDDPGLGQQRQVAADADRRPRRACRRTARGRRWPSGPADRRRASAGRRR